MRHGKECTEPSQRNQGLAVIPREKVVYFSTHVSKMSMKNSSLHRFALFTAFSTFVLIFIGGLVTSTNSGLAVPDWPTTYGENMFTYPIDKWVGGIKYEHGHRLVASFVGFVTLILAVWLGISEPRRWVRNAGYAALAAVIVQGILGGITVLFLLPTAVSMAHGMLAQTFFCLVAAIALFTSRWWQQDFPSGSVTELTRLRTFAGIATGAVFLQLAFGALLRHTYSGLSVPDFPLAYGGLFPDLSEEALAGYHRELISRGIKWPGDTPASAFQISIHLIHRYWAFIVAGIVSYAGYAIGRSTSLPVSVQRNGRLLIIFVLIQFCLGIFTVLTRKEYIITSLHVVIGALVLVTCVITTIQIIRLRWSAMRNG